MCFTGWAAINARRLSCSRRQVLPQSRALADAALPFCCASKPQPASVVVHPSLATLLLTVLTPAVPVVCLLHVVCACHCCPHHYCRPSLSAQPCCWCCWLLSISPAAHTGASTRCARPLPCWGHLLVGRLDASTAANCCRYLHALVLPDAAVVDAALYTPNSRPALPITCCPAHAFR